MHQINPFFILFVHSWIKENTTEWALFNSKSSHFQSTQMICVPLWVQKVSPFCYTHYLNCPFQVRHYSFLMFFTNYNWPFSVWLWTFHTRLLCYLSSSSSSSSSFLLEISSTSSHKCIWCLLVLVTLPPPLPPALCGGGVGVTISKVFLLFWNLGMTYEWLV